MKWGAGWYLRWSKVVGLRSSIKLGLVGWALGPGGRAEEGRAGWRVDQAGQGEVLGPGGGGTGLRQRRDPSSQLRTKPTLLDLHLLDSCSETDRCKFTH